MKVNLKQQATYLSDNWWNWSVWVEGDKADLKRIEYVEYILHPSFPQPVLRIDNQSSKFRLDSAGWGEFTIRAIVVTKNGEKKNLRHRLELTYPEEGTAEVEKHAPEKGNVPQTLPSTIFVSCNVADSLFANALSKVFVAQGARVLMVADESNDLPWDDSINQLLDQADCAVFIISDAPSIWMKREVEAAIKHEVPIIAVVITSGKVKPSELHPKMKHAIQVRPVPPENFDEEAQELAQRIKKKLKSILMSANKKAASKS